MARTKTFLTEIGINGGSIRNRKLIYGKFSYADLYTFGYPNPIWKNELPFWDKRPLMLFLGYDSTRRLVHGINFHFIYPENIRKATFTAIQEMRESRTSRMILNLAWRERFSRMGLGNSTSHKVWVAYRQYSPFRMVNVKMVSEKQWDKAYQQVKPLWQGANEVIVQEYMKTLSRSKILREKKNKKPIRSK